MTPMRTSLAQAPREPMNRDELRAMAKAAWKRGIAVIWLDEVRNDFNKQVIINECEAQYGER